MVEVQEHQKDLLTLLKGGGNQINTDGYSGDLPFGGQLIGSNGFREDGVNRSA